MRTDRQVGPDGGRGHRSADAGRAVGRAVLVDAGLRPAQPRAAGRRGAGEADLGGGRLDHRQQPGRADAARNRTRRHRGGSHLPAGEDPAGRIGVGERSPRGLGSPEPARTTDGRPAERLGPDQRDPGRHRARRAAADAVVVRDGAGRATRRRHHAGRPRPRRRRGRTGGARWCAVTSWRWIGPDVPIGAAAW